MRSGIPSGAHSTTETRGGIFTWEWLGDRRGLVFLLLLSLALKMALFLLTDVIDNDGPTYVNEALRFLDGDFLSVVREDINFFYSALLALATFAIPDPVVAGRLLSLILSVLTVLPLYFLIAELFSARAAFWGCLAFAVLPGFNKFAVSLMRDPLFIFLFACAMFLAVRAISSWQRRYFILLSVLSLVLPLARIEGVLFAPLFLLGCSLLIVWRRPGRAALKSVAIYLLPFLLIGVLVVFLAVARPSALPKAGQINKAANYFLHHGFSPDPVLKQKLEELEHSLPKGWSDNDFGEIAREHIRLFYFIGVLSQLVAVVSLVPFALFLYGFYRHRQSACYQHFLVAGFLLSYLVMGYFYNIHRGFLEERYLYVAALLICPWFGFGLEKVEQGMGRIPFSKVLFPSIILLFASVFIGDAIREKAKPEPECAIAAGEWLAAQPDLQGKSLLANEKKIPYYAGRRDRYTSSEGCGNECLEKRAKLRQFSLITILTRKSNAATIPVFEGYSIIHQAEDRRHSAFIYRLN